MAPVRDVGRYILPFMTTNIAPTQYRVCGYRSLAGDDLPDSARGNVDFLGKAVLGYPHGDQELLFQELAWCYRVQLLAHAYHLLSNGNRLFRRFPLLLVSS